MIIYQGESQIDGSPIVAILTGFDTKSKNSKTGEMPQVWIMRSDMHPIDALRTGADSAICGNCIHRPKLKGKKALTKGSRTCYVTVMALSSIYNTFAEGKYKVADVDELALQLSNKNIRLGAYGDPAAVPIEVWDKLCKYCKSTGYTHQWRNCDERFAEYCMASCDSPIDVLQSTVKGYRTFFVQNVKEITEAFKSVKDIKLAWCPASKEKGRATTCSKCMACSGTRSNLHSNISIMMH
jgi:hypothetical protein